MINLCYRPHTLEELVYLTDTYQERYQILAGGTDLAVKIKEKLVQPDILIDISRIERLKEINLDQKIVSIGALATHYQIAKNKFIAHKIPVLAEACSVIGSPAIRNLGTLGGNLVTASPAADSIPALLALEAKVVIASKHLEKEVSLTDFFVGPGKTMLVPGEIVTQVKIPLPGANENCQFAKIGKRAAMAISVVNGAVNLQLDNEGERFGKVIIAVGAVAPTVTRLWNLEKFLTGEKVSKKTLLKVPELVAEEVKPVDDIRASAGYRKRVAGVLVESLINKAWQSLREGA
jgi:CO/xanthine dehydrogenase FAD-binding subunit